MTFEIGYYYRTTHKREGKNRPARCTIKIVKLLNKHCYDYGDLYDVKLIKVPRNSGYKKGSVIHWYEDWCFNTRKLEDYESLVIEL